MKRTPAVVDLTQPLGPQTVLWPGSKPFHAALDANYESSGMYFRSITMPEHSGTHLDAPSHFHPGGDHVIDIPAHRLVVPANVIDLRGLVSGDPAFTVDRSHIETFEKEHGEIEPGSAVLVCTGWDRFLGDSAAYVGDVGATSFPGVGPDVPGILIERGVVGLGIDTLGVDPGYSTDHPVHHTTLPAGLWHLEGLVNLHELPTKGALLVVGALRLVDGSGTPARVFALL
jgi:kynurenine formamidase